MFANVKSALFATLDNHIFSKAHDSTCISPRHTPFKWIALFFCCLTTIGGYYCYGAPSTMQTPIMNVFGISTTHFNMLFTVYSLPNIVMPILGGFIIDKLGVRFGLFLFSFLICVGQAFVVLGAYIESFNVMIAGGAALGVGLESLCAAKSAIVLKWFQGQELALAMGLTLTISRLGQSLSSFLAPWLYARDLNLALPFNFGLFLGIFSVVMVLILCFLDIYADDREESLASYQTRNKEVFKISDMKDFRFIFYLIVLNCMIVYSVIICFLNNSNDLMNKRFGFTPQMSGNYISIIFIMATVLSPVFGGVIDRIGRRVQMIFASIVIMALVHLDVAFLSDTDSENPNTNIVWALIGVGTAYSAYAAVVWPSIGLLVKENATGTAYGFALGMQNLMLGLVPLIVGIIHDSTLETSFGYFWTSIFLFALSLAGVANTIWIKIEDGKTGSVLESPTVDKTKELYQGLVEEENGIELSDKIGKPPKRSF